MARSLSASGFKYQALDPSAEEIPSIEITELGLVGFNAATDRTGIGLGVNLPQFSSATPTRCKTISRMRQAAMRLSLASISGVTSWPSFSNLRPGEDCSIPA